MTRVLLVLVFLAGAPRARADTEKSANVALGISFAATLGSMAVALVGVSEKELHPLAYTSGALMVLAPTAGHWYAGHYVTHGLAIRLLGAGIIAHGVFACHSENDGACPSGTEISVGALVVLAGAIDDFVTLPAAVRKRNARGEVTIGPAFGGRGVAIAGRF